MKYYQNVLFSLFFIESIIGVNSVPTRNIYFDAYKNGNDDFLDKSIINNNKEHNDRNDLNSINVKTPHNSSNQDFIDQNSNSYNYDNAFNVNMKNQGSDKPKKIEKRELPRLKSITPNTKPSILVERLLQNYIKTDPPSQSATEVQLGVYVISIYSVNEQTMDYSISMYLRQSWIDPRLEYLKYGMTYGDLRMGKGSWNKIWIPDTFLRNEKGASFHSVTVDNRMMNLNETGRLWYVSKITATLSCLMTLENFPMDTQICPMAFESFGYESKVMYFNNLPDMIQRSDDLQLPQFTLVQAYHRNCSQSYVGGLYPCLEVNFILKRDLGYFLIQVYVPSVLIVILSWVSFWINVDASPARVSIGLLTVLTTTTMSSGARSTLPRVSYIKAIDVWMIVCLVFVFTSLIEYAVVNVLARKSTKPNRGQNTGTILKRNAPNSCVAMQQTQRRKATPLAKCCKPKEKPSANPPEADGKKRARSVDKLSRKFFPLAFIFFNCVYWVYYFKQPE